MRNPNCCFMIIAENFFFSSQSPRGTVLYKVKLPTFIFYGSEKVVYSTYAAESGDSELDQRVLNYLVLSD